MERKKRPIKHCKECGTLLTGFPSKIKKQVFCTSKCQGSWYKKNGSPTTTHGMSYTPEGRTYRGMKTRCYNPNDKSFSRYGARGIKICDRWLGKDGFTNFFNDMGKRPNGYSIDRIDNNGDYSPENCRWATVEQQIYNRNKTLRFTYNGMTKTAPEWSRELGISIERIRDRHSKGWSDERVLTQPVRKSIK